MIHAAARQQRGSIGKEAFSTLCTGLKQNYGSLWEYGKLSYYPGSLIFAKEKAFLGTVCLTVDIDTMASVKVIKCSRTEAGGSSVFHSLLTDRPIPSQANSLGPFADFTFTALKRRAASQTPLQ